MINTGIEAETFPLLLKAATALSNTTNFVIILT